MVDIKITKEKEERILKFVKKGQFASVDDFVKSAVDLMLYAEENKDSFMQSLSN